MNIEMCWLTGCCTNTTTTLPGRPFSSQSQKVKDKVVIFETSVFKSLILLHLGAFREIRNVELLKLRFGESHMHYCEVMLKVMFPKSSSHQ